MKKLKKSYDKFVSGLIAYLASELGIRNEYKFSEIRFNKTVTRYIKANVSEEDAKNIMPCAPIGSVYANPCLGNGYCIFYEEGLEDYKRNVSVYASFVILSAKEAVNVRFYDGRMYFNLVSRYVVNKDPDPRKTCCEVIAPESSKFLKKVKALARKYRSEHPIPPRVYERNVILVKHDGKKDYCFVKSTFDARMAEILRNCTDTTKVTISRRRIRITENIENPAKFKIEEV